MAGRNVRRWVALWAAVGLFLVTPWVAHAEDRTVQETPQPSEERVQEELDQELAERRQAMLKEAHAALDETRQALIALGEDRAEDALEALARATGKLELLVAREPELALAPVSFAVATHDLYATPDSIRNARKQVERLLDDGKVQEARRLLSGLASEIVVSVTNLPLATYPQAIKAVSPLIDAGKGEQARVALEAALGTLVVTDHVIPLPIVRARHMLDEAEELANLEQPSGEDESRVARLVDDARLQVEMAGLLGYGSKARHEEFRAQIAALEKKIGAEEQTAGAFARLRRQLSELQMAWSE